MKLTKSQLKQIIKEELEEVAEFNYPSHNLAARINVRGALRSTAAKLHPESYLSKMAEIDNPEIFKAINTAYSILAEVIDGLAQDLETAERLYPIEPAPVYTKQERSKPFKWQENEH